MRLLRINIEKFGTLSQFSMDLKEGVNEVLEENGWGKSTLAAFLRVMFYGLEGARKKELSENDRLKYQPWDQGPFGGSIEFEVNGKRYVATRFFGQKEKDATFRLQEATTLLDSKDYSEHLGEELFGIDRESFEKTSFIDGDAIRYHGINSAIGSKVGSISQTEDLANYDAAQEQMKDFLNANSPKKRTGKLFQIEDSIKELERDLKKMDAAK
ncbi:MAG: AAA family ATPase, partial [Lachnospiraceae bacterium]|nr:AAA family ATPase [Lachnospiraceae bacterium]